MIMYVVHEVYIPIVGLTNFPVCREGTNFIRL